MNSNLSGFENGILSYWAALFPKCDRPEWIRKLDKFARAVGKTILEMSQNRDIATRDKVAIITALCYLDYYHGGGEIFIRAVNKYYPSYWAYCRKLEKLRAKDERSM